MEKGGMKGGREWCSLTWARRRPCPIMRASRRFQAVVSGAAIVVSIRGCSCPFVGVRVHSWALMSRSCPFLGIRVRSWALVSCSCPSVSVCVPSCRIRVRLCPFVAVCGPCVVFVSIHGPSCCVRGRLCRVCVRWWVFISVDGRSSWCHGWCDVGPVSHVKEEEGGVWGCRTHLDARCTTWHVVVMVYWPGDVASRRCPGVLWCRCVLWLV